MRRRTTTLALCTAAVALATPAVELFWVQHRRLPSLVGIDASGRHVGSRASSAPPLRMVALGDSTLTGPGLDDPADIWLRQALRRIDPPGCIDVMSLAVGGSRVADVAARVDEAIALRPDIVVIAVGANDAIHGTAVGQFEQCYDGVIGKLAANVACVAAANIGDLGNIARVPWPLSAGLRHRSNRICAAIMRVIAAHDVVLLDVRTSSDAFRDRSVFGGDLFHPNRCGHALWADAVTPGLTRALADHPTGNA